MNFMKSATAKNTILFNIIVVLTLALGLSSCQNPVTVPPASTVPVTGVSLNKSSLSLATGLSERLTAIVAPLDAKNKIVSWSSSNANVSVSPTGMVSALIPGTATVTVTTLDGSFTASCSVTVTVPIIAVTGVTLNKATTSIALAETEQLSATVMPLAASDKSVTWSTSSVNASVSPTGLVTALDLGTAVITATTVDGSFAASCTVTVTAPVISVTGVSLNKTSASIVLGQTDQLSATIAPANATNKAVTWTTSGAAASVSSTGLVTAVSVGSATITVTSADGSFTASCAVTVTPIRVTGVTLNKSAATLIVGGTDQLSATIAPANATNKAVTWTTSGGAASVSSTGLVTAVSVGSATITVTSADGSFTATCAVTVNPVNVTGITLNKSSASIPLGYTEQLTATIAPANATNKTVIWSSSGSAAGVSSSGLVTALSLGTATITATSVDGSFSRSCAVTVIPVPVTGVTLNKSTMALVAGHSEALTATVNPTGAANKAVVWTSNNNNIAAVSDGTVMAFAAGTAYITVTTVDGAFTATCIVTVTGTLAHTYSDVLPAATALQNGINAAVASNDPSSPAYSTVVLFPSVVVTCHFQNYVNTGYTLNGSVSAAINANQTLGPMNGTVLFSGGIVTEITYTNAVFTAPMSGSLFIRFSDGISGTVNLATGIFIQN